VTDFFEMHFQVLSILETSVPAQVQRKAIELLTVLGTHSLSVRDLHQIFQLLRNYHPLTLEIVSAMR
jgi:fucose 4-O-acetylase-like acetyltransferase